MREQPARRAQRAEHDRAAQRQERDEVGQVGEELTEQREAHDVAPVAQRDEVGDVDDEQRREQRERNEAAESARERCAASRRGRHDDTEQEYAAEPERGDEAEVDRRDLRRALGAAREQRDRGRGDRELERRERREPQRVARAVAGEDHVISGRRLGAPELGRARIVGAKLRQRRELPLGVVARLGGIAPPQQQSTTASG